MDQEGTYKWIQDRLRDLHSGTLSEADRLRLQEIAKTDPFIRDALDGFTAHTDHDHSALLKILSERIQNKSKTSRPKLLPLSRGWILQAVAASLVLILATWAVIYYVEKQNEYTYIASAPPANDSPERSTEVQLNGPDSTHKDLGMDKSSVGESDHSSSGTISKEKAETKKKEESREHGAGKQPEASFKQQNGYTSTDAPSSSPPSAPLVNAASRETVIDNKSKEPETIVKGDDAGKNISKKDEGNYANQMNPAIMKLRVNGQIRNRSGDALIGAMVAIQNTNLVTTTDAKGKFEIYLPDQKSSVQISNSGYRDTIVNISRGQEDMVIMLDERQNELPSGVLAGSESKIQRANTEEMKSLSPTDQQAGFLVYLKSNSEFPIADMFTLTAHEVTVGFRVSAIGRPDVIRMVKSFADPKYMAEAIRLIQKGPDWKCEGDVYPCEREYTIYFK